MRSELEALSAGIDGFSTDLSSVLLLMQKSAKLENVQRMELSAVPEALVTVRAASDEMKGESEGKGEPAISCSGKGKGRWRKPNSAKHLQDKLAARKANSTCHECGQRGHWAGGARDTNVTTWSDERILADREDYRAVMIVELRFARAPCLHHFCSEFATVPCQ